ncbi:ArsR/SmtB family transcription factor [Alicyclobacillus tolerans]|uniref:ArsR/SmtB family transcription factor n=1 Tax=Alicyclobacillus tolerans TaxID=90970 RepID=UPI003B7E9A8B
MDKHAPMSITADQFELLSSSIRVRIMYVLKDNAMTSKQVAEYLQESPGNVHYHMQKLYKGGLLELVETKESSGILEKYYRSVADRFEISDLKNHTGISGRTRSRMFAYFNLTEQELQMFVDELMELLTKWENRTSSTGASEVVFDGSIVIPDTLRKSGI